MRSRNENKSGMLCNVNGDTIDMYPNEFNIRMKIFRMIFFCCSQSTNTGTNARYHDSFFYDKTTKIDSFFVLTLDSHRTALCTADCEHVHNFVFSRISPHMMEAVQLKGQTKYHRKIAYDWKKFTRPLLKSDENEKKKGISSMKCERKLMEATEYCERLHLA